METLGVLAGVIGTVVAIVTYQQSISKKDEIEHLVTLFRSTQKLSLETRTLIEEYVNKHNCGSDFIFPNITYDGYLKSMRDGYEEFLSDAVLERVVNARPSKSIITSMIQSVEKQSEALRLIKLQMKVFLDTH